MKHAGNKSCFTPVRECFSYAVSLMIVCPADVGDGRHEMLREASRACERSLTNDEKLFSEGVAIPQFRNQGPPENDYICYQRAFIFKSLSYGEQKYVLFYAFPGAARYETIVFASVVTERSDQSNDS